MDKVVNQIDQYPDTMNTITAVSEILDLHLLKESKLCFTITYANDEFLNVSRSYSANDREKRLREIRTFQNQMLDHLKEKPSSEFNKDTILNEICTFVNCMSTA